MTAFSVQDQRPPYVRFEDRPVEDRDESIKQGRRIEKTETVAIIHAIGSKDETEREVNEWFVDLEAKVQRRQYPGEWLEAFRKKHAEHKLGQEETVDGTHVRSWALIDRATANNLVGAGVLTVEDVAQMNEQALQRVGMNSRSLKQKAVDWLKMADKKKGAAELEKQRARADNAEARIASLEEQLAQVLAKMNQEQI